ncbi:MAG: hypothetical protein Q9191_006660, partial [Dirinaria sp. TL-2023a]
MPDSPHAFTKAEYYTIFWVLTGLAILFTAARIGVRLKVYGRLMVDDGLVILALVCLLAGSIMFSVLIDTTFTVQDVHIYHAKPPPHFENLTHRFAKYQWAGAYLFFTGIWSVKGSFLAFYDDLTKRLPLYRRGWWVTIVITVLTYIGSLLAYAFLDGVRLTNNSKNEAIKYQFSADLITDLLIKSRVPAKQKLGLAGIFSLTFIITIMSIVRFALNAPSSGVTVPSWLQAWSVIEQGVSVIISCFASFRIYVMNKTKTSKASSSKGRYMNSFIAQKLRSASSKSGHSQLESHRAHASTENGARDSMDVELLDMANSKRAEEQIENLRITESHLDVGPSETPKGANA